jgi:hypothetical protein
MRWAFQIVVLLKREPALAQYDCPVYIHWIGVSIAAVVLKYSTCIKHYNISLMDDVFKAYVLMERLFTWDDTGLTKTQQY